MITINNLKFAETEKEFTETLFHRGGTAAGYAKRLKRRIDFFDLQKKPIACLTAYGVLARVTMQDGRRWYSYGDPDLIGELSIADRRDLADRLATSFMWKGSDKFYAFKELKK